MPKLIGGSVERGKREKQRAKAEACLKDLQPVIKKHGFDVVKSVVNRLTEQAKLEKEIEQKEFELKAERERLERFEI